MKLGLRFGVTILEKYAEVAEAKESNLSPLLRKVSIPTGGKYLIEGAPKRDPKKRVLLLKHKDRHLREEVRQPKRERKASKDSSSRI